MKVGKKSLLKKSLMLASAAIAAAVFASSARADSLAVGDSLTLKAVGVNGFTSNWASNTPQVTVNYKNIGPGGNASKNGEVDYAGQIDWTGTDTTQGGESLSFLTYCVQLTTDIVVPSGNTPYTVSNLASTMDIGNPTNTATASEIAALIALNPTQLIPAGSGLFGESDSAHWEAFQVAIWDLVYNRGTDVSGNSFNVAAGINFNVSSSQTSVISLADQFLNKLLLPSSNIIDTSSVAQTSNGGFLITTGDLHGQTIYGLTGTSGTQNQSVLAIAANPGAIVAPLPGVLGGMLGLLGITGLAARRRNQLA